MTGPASAELKLPTQSSFCAAPETDIRRFLLVGDQSLLQELDEAQSLSW